jgi:hypothetical protein
MDQKKTWNAAANFGLEFHTDKSGTNIPVGDLGTVEGGVGKTFYKKVSGPIPIIMNAGLAVERERSGASTFFPPQSGVRCLQLGNLGKQEFPQVPRERE